MLSDPELVEDSAERNNNSIAIVTNREVRNEPL